MDTILGGLGSLFATGPGVLTIVLTAATAVVLWRWSVALAVLVFVNLGACATFVYLHGAPALLVSGQVLAITLSAVLLGAAQWLRHPTPSLHQPGNWLLRAFALVFISGAWWFIDPGVRVPAFAQAETDMLLWLALCGMITLTLTNNPLFVGVGLLLWSVPTYALALVLLPGSGLSALLGIGEIMVALACAFLVLAEPGQATMRVQRVHLPNALALRLATNPLTRRIRSSAPDIGQPGAAQMAATTIFVAAPGPPPEPAAGEPGTAKEQTP